MANTSNSAVLAGPPGLCCITTVKHEGEAVGKTISIGELNTYVSEPPSKDDQKKIILYLPDVFGPFSLNAQLLQDYFASNGFLVLSPDYYLGDYFNTHSEFLGLDEADPVRDAWFMSALKRAQDVFPRWLSAVKAAHGPDAQYFTTGYCFGAPFVCDLAAGDEVIAAAFAHPSFLNEDHFKNIKKPLFLSCTDADVLFQTQFRRRAEDILVDLKTSYHVQLFTGAAHGFSTHGDPKNANDRWVAEECARGILGWFKRFSK